MKKWAKITIASVAVAGVTTAIAVPVALEVNKKEELQDFQKIDMTQNAWQGTTLQQLVDGVKHEEQIKGSLVTKLSEVAAFSLYDDEQTGSVQLQKDTFEYQIWKLDRQLAEKITDSGGHQTDRYTGASRTTLQSNKTTIQGKLTKLNGGLSDSDYNSLTFSRDYPLILMKRSIITTRQNNILQDTKNSFVAQFSTRAEGENAWINEVKKKYNGATSDAEAVSMLVYGIIKNDAYASTKFKLNQSYTVEQRLFAEEQKAASKHAFDFLLNAYISSDVQGHMTNSLADTDPRLTDSELSKKLFFISSNSKNSSKIYIDPDKAATELEKLNLVSTSHALIAAKQNVKGESLPWDIKKEALIGKDDGSNYGILGFFGAAPQKNFYTLLNELKSATTTDAGWHGDFKQFVEKATGQPSAKKDGLLGMKEKLESVTGMVKGFAIGAIEAMYTQKHSAIASVADGKAVIDALVTSIGNWFTANSITTQDELTQKINSMTDDQVTQTFGSMFRDAFKDGTSTSLRWVYHVAGNIYIVTSQFGVHFINIEAQDKTRIKTTIEADIKKSFDDQSTSDVKLNYSQLMTKYRSQETLLKDMMADTAFVAKVKAGYEKTSTAKINSDFPDQLDANGHKIAWADLLVSINAALDNVQDAARSGKMNQILDANGIKYISDKYDKKLFAETVGGTGTDKDTTLSAEEIYNRGLEVGEVTP